MTPHVVRVWAAALTKMWLFLSCLTVLCGGLALSGCERCSGAAPLARLTEKRELVERDHNAAKQDWSVAKNGATFEFGDAVRTAAGASARLNLDDGSILGLDEETLIRFLDTKPGDDEQTLDLQMGSAMLEAAAEGAVLRTEFGTARLEGGGRIQLSRKGNALRYEVLVGSAVVEGRDGGRMKLDPGQVVEATLGSAVMELIEAKPTSKQDGTESAAGPLAGGPVSAVVSGATVKLTAPGAQQASALAAGEHLLQPGSVVQVGAGSSVGLSRGAENAELRGGGTYVVGTEGSLVTARSGALSVSSSGTVRILVPGGSIVTRAGAATITAEGAKGTRVQAEAGTVTLEGRGSAELSAGEEGRIGTNGAIVVKGRGLGRADVSIQSGQTLVIHDPAPPTAVGFLFGTQCERGVIKLNGQRSAIPGERTAHGKGRVILALGPGRVDYSLQCRRDDGTEGPPVATGRVTVLQDSGTRPVPKNAPSTYVDVTGRNYNVLYQNQLPRVTVQWSAAPKDASGFTLHLSSGGRTRSYSTTKPAYTFSSGSLGEGTHQVYFEGGGRVSRRSSIAIHFDNATPAVSLQTPVSSGVGPGGQLPIRGTALPGWSVTVDGKPVGQDAEGRFSVNTSMPTDGRPTTVQLTHPTRGAHVYLRRPGGGR